MDATDPPPAPARPIQPTYPLQLTTPFAVVPSQKENCSDPDRLYYAKPDTFDDRKLCGAPVSEGTGEQRKVIGWCGVPVGECQRHCGAWAHSRGHACPSRRARGQKRCKMHGGKVSVGAAHPSFVHGRYSSVLPKDLKKAYLKELRDPEMLTSRDEIALLRARLIQLAARLDGKESGRALLDIRDAWREFLAASEAKPPDEARIDEAGNELNRLITAGATAEEQWDEFNTLASRKTAMAQVEWKRMIEMHSMVPIDQVMTLVATLIDAVHRHVTDPEAKRRLSQEISAIIGR